MIDPRTLRPLDLDTILASVAQDQPLRDRRGGLAARRRGREPRRADRRTGLRRPRRAGHARDRRRRADALLQAARGHRLSRTSRRSCAAALATLGRSPGRERRTADGRDRDAAAVGHDGGGHDPALAEARRRARRRGEELVEIETDKADHDLRVRPGGSPRDRRRRGRHARGRRADRAGRLGGDASAPGDADASGRARRPATGRRRAPAPSTAPRQPRAGAAPRGARSRSGRARQGLAARAADRARERRRPAAR